MQRSLNIAQSVVDQRREKEKVLWGYALYDSIGNGQKLSGGIATASPIRKGQGRNVRPNFQKMYMNTIKWPEEQLQSLEGGREAALENQSLVITTIRRLEHPKSGRSTGKIRAQFEIFLRIQ